MKDATHILLTHGHGDHTGDALALSRETGAPLVGIYDLMGHWEVTEGVATVGFNKGGTVHLGRVAVSMVAATHSSSLGSDAEPVYAGAGAGYIIRGEGHCIWLRTQSLETSRAFQASVPIFLRLHPCPS